MHIRQKGKAIRMTLADTSRPDTIDYVAIDAPECWSATFNAWGKRIETPIINLGGKQFKIVLEEIR